MSHVEFISCHVQHCQISHNFNQNYTTQTSVTQRTQATFHSSDFSRCSASRQLVLLTMSSDGCEPNWSILADAVFFFFLIFFTTKQLSKEK